MLTRGEPLHGETHNGRSAYDVGPHSVHTCIPGYLQLRLEDGASRVGTITEHNITFDAPRTRRAHGCAPRLAASLTITESFRAAAGGEALAPPTISIF